jgi:hypothetical protein
LEQEIKTKADDPNFNHQLSFYVAASYRYFVLPMPDNRLKPIVLEYVNAGVIVSGELFNRKFFLDQYCGSNQTHIIFSILDNVIDQLLSELLIFINLKGIIIEAAEEFFKLIKVHHVAV